MPEAPETTTHILLRCPFAAAFWSTVGIRLCDDDDATRLHHHIHIPAEGLINTFILLCCWHLWNERVFRNEEHTLPQTLRRCREDAKLWRVRHGRRGHQNVSNVQHQIWSPNLWHGKFGA